MTKNRRAPLIAGLPFRYLSNSSGGTPRRASELSTAPLLVLLLLLLLYLSLWRLNLPSLKLPLHF
jgi:hypothetical protein